MQVFLQIVQRVVTDTTCRMQRPTTKKDGSEEPSVGGIPSIESGANETQHYTDEISMTLPIRFLRMYRDGQDQTVRLPTLR